MRLILKPSKKAFSLIELSIVILIIGILVAGVMQASRIVTKSRILSARTLTISSPVASIKDLSLWLEPTLETSFYGVTNGYNLGDGESVSAWNDINPTVPYKTNFSQSSSSARPTYKENGIGSLPSLYFNGSSNYMAASANAIISGSSQYTIIAVWQASNIAYGQIRTIFAQRGSSCANGYAGITTASFSLYGWSGGCADTNSSLPIASGQNYASIYRVENTTSNNVTLYSNGTKYGPVTKSLGTIGTALETDIGYGFGAGGASYLQGFISEIIVYTRALTTEEMTYIRKYLSQKYGFAA